VRQLTELLPELAERLPDSGRRTAAELRLISLPGFPRVASGDDLAALTAAALARGGLALQADDVLVFAQTFVSTAEGPRVDLAGVTPGPAASQATST